ncbi:MAG: hypothetical protein U1F70_13985 [Candidatus Competibacteraceae bacterium]
MNMKLVDIKQALKQALIQDGEMNRKLYEYELEEHLDYLKSSMTKDRDDFIFVVTVRINTLTSNHDVAMLLMENSGKIYINESARDRLQELWSLAYSSNMNKLIPEFARQIKNNELPINGVKTIKKFMA